MIPLTQEVNDAGGITAPVVEVVSTTGMTGAVMALNREAATVDTEVIRAARRHRRPRAMGIGTTEVIDETTLLAHLIVGPRRTDL